MQPAPLPPQEFTRLAALQSYDVLDTEAEAALDDLVSLAARLTHSPIALISLVDAERQWFKARYGLGAPETPRDLAFCAHAILTPDLPFSVPDASRDPRFAGNPLVTGAPDIRAYLGVPLVSPEGQALGTMCVIDRVPREHDAEMVDVVRRLARAAMTHLELRRALHRAHTAARTDALTGLLNRSALMSELATVLGRGEPVAVIAMDLDHFKEANDAYGHAAGDALLRAAAERIRAAVGPSGQVGRLGGDEFAAFLPGVGDWDAASAVASAIARSVAEPVPNGERLLRLGTTLGVALAPADAGTPEVLARLADEALIRAKRHQRGTVGRARADDAGRVAREAALLLALRDAAETPLPGLTAHFQPIMTLGTGEVAAVEALARWNHPELGAVPPDEMFAAAARLGQSGALSRQTRACALEAFAGLRRDGLAPPRINLNLSAAELLCADVVQTLEAQVAEAGIDMTSITLEITEDAVLDRVAHATLDRLSALRGRGARIALDDFGTGTSGLAQLLRIPLDAIKLDGIFTKRLGTDAKAAQVVEGAARLGRALGLDVTAEGIEHEGQARLLLGLGCDLGQGWHYGRPMGEVELRAWLRGRDAGGKVVRLRASA